MKYSRIKRQLQIRQNEFDSLSTDAQKGRKRPGSMNRSKTGGIPASIGNP